MLFKTRQALFEFVLNHRGEHYFHTLNELPMETDCLDGYTVLVYDADNKLTPHQMMKQWGAQLGLEPFESEEDVSRQVAEEINRLIAGNRRVVFITSNADRLTIKQYHVFKMIHEWFLIDHTWKVNREAMPVQLFIGNIESIRDQLEVTNRENGYLSRMGFL